MTLQEFDFHVIYKSGKHNVDADCLSRYIKPKSDETEEPEKDVMFINSLESFSLSSEQRRDHKLKKIFDDLKTFESLDKNEKSNLKNYTEIDSALYKL